MSKVNSDPRLSSLYELDILETAAEQCFDDITALASTICETPIAIMSLVDETKLWFKSKFGIDVESISKDGAFCAFAIEQAGPFIIKDTHKDERFKNSPLVTGGLNVRFYAGIPLKSNSGHNIGTLCVIDSKERDITADQVMALQRLARQIEQLLSLRMECKLHLQVKGELKSSEEWSHMLFDNSSDMMGIIKVKDENNFVLLNANSAFCLTMKIAKEKIQFKKLQDFLPNCIVNEVFFHINKVMLDKMGHGFEIYFLLGSRTFWFESVISPKFSEEGNVSHLLIVSRDITERKKSEEIIAQQNMAIAKTAKFSELGELAGSMAHEINNPLTIIVSRSERLKNSLLKMEYDYETFLKGITQINNTSLRIAKIVRSLKTLSRHAESDPMTVINIKTIIEDAQFLCEERLKTADIKLIINYPEDFPIEIEARSTQITQVLINLINNSVHAIAGLEDKWIEIKVDESYDKSMLLIRSTDSGNGIPPQIQKKIMDPFFTTKEVGKGTGLGLSISRGIVESHQGSLYYDSTSKNTCFIIELPRTQKRMAKNAV